MDSSWYKKLVAGGWLGSMPQISQEQDSKKNWRDYVPDETADVMGEAIRNYKSKLQKKPSDESSG
jgi:hypothetical protein